jgi:prevent-host-death family protein
MHQVNIHEAKTHLSRLLERVERGERIVIARAGKPVAVLVPASEVVRERRFDLYKGQIKIADDFDELPEDMIEAFEGDS